jgi:membrane protease YdiL (CAAX protease family)
MNPKHQRRLAALFEVLGVFVVGVLLQHFVTGWFVHLGIVSPKNPFDMLSVQMTDNELLVASRCVAFLLITQYLAYFIIIVPLNWWYRQRGPAAYGLTLAGRSLWALILTGVATACLCEWPTLAHTIIDAIHPLGATVPWRQAFFEMSWRRWQFWLFAGLMSYGLVPLFEELVFRGYYQRRLAEDWGDGPAIIGTACLFTFAHAQYLVANLYDITMVLSLLFMAFGLGLVFAWTRSLVPSIIAHAIINFPMTPRWQAIALLAFAIGAFFAWRGGVNAVKEVFKTPAIPACLLLAILETAYIVAAERTGAIVYAAGLLIVLALGMEIIDRRRGTSRSIVAHVHDPTVSWP